LREILCGIPDPLTARVGVLGNGDGPRHAFVEGHFRRVLPFHVQGPRPRRLDLVVVPDGLDAASRKEFDRTFAAIRDALREGGILVGTLPARSRKDPAFIVRPARSASELDDRPLHEIELQYRLRVAGFQGLRIRRFRAELGHPDTVVFTAVRRAPN
jgi:hypothetical protein